MSSTSIPRQGQLHAVHVLGAAAGAHVSSLAGGLVARGVEVTVCGPAAAESDYAFPGTGARFVPVDIGRGANAARRRPGGRRAARGLRGRRASSTPTACGPDCSPPSRSAAGTPRWS